MEKKKNLLRLLAIMMAAVLCVGFVSCGDDDDDGEDVPLGKENNALLGGWSEMNFSMVLMTNGKMLYYKSSSSGQDDVKEGNWNYNEQTGILATDVEYYQWNVNLISEDSWAGIRLWTQKPVTATRKIAFTARMLLAGRTWIFNGMEKSYHLTDGWVRQINSTDVSEDRSKDVMTIKHSKDIYEIHHPYDYDNVYILFPSGNKYYPKK
ncbi:MAG: hypothetical protein J5913_06570 [Prevotella sp.]|nr:hypothetical protein [Prevotella sp.]